MLDSAWQACGSEQRGKAHLSSAFRAGPAADVPGSIVHSRLFHPLSLLRMRRIRWERQTGDRPLDRRLNGENDSRGCETETQWGGIITWLRGTDTERIGEGGNRKDKFVTRSPPQCHRKLFLVGVSSRIPHVNGEQGRRCHLHEDDVGSDKRRFLSIQPSGAFILKLSNTVAISRAQDRLVKSRNQQRTPPLLF